jgi:uncharacterized protein YaaQ
MIIIIMRDSDDETMIQALLQNEYRVTRMSSTGGFLKQGNVTLLVGVKEERLQGALQLVRETCATLDDSDEQHRATIFVVDMPHFEQV